MTYHGTIRDGVIVLKGAPRLPEGGSVEVTVVASPESETKPQPIWEELAELARQAENQPCNLPTDLAENHDHYLHGLPKRK